MVMSRKYLDAKKKKKTTIRVQIYVERNIKSIHSNINFLIYIYVVDKLLFFYLFIYHIK